MHAYMRLENYTSTILLTITHNVIFALHYSYTFQKVSLEEHLTELLIELVGQLRRDAG